MANSASATLILGTSGSGKSYLAKSLCSISSLPVLVINGSEKDYDPENFEHITYHDFYDNEEGINNCMLIIEDIVKPNEFECKVINQILVKNKRHQNINLYALAHSIERNNLHSMLQHFDFVVFSNHAKTQKVFEVYAKKIVGINEDECAQRWRDFVKSGEPKTNYLRYNNNTSQFELIDVKGNLLVSPESKLRKEIISYIEPFGQIKESAAFLDFLIKRLPPGVIDDEHLTLSFENSKGHKFDVTIIDLVVFVVSKNLERPPPPEIIYGFKNLQKLYKIPYCFIGNKYFQD